MMMMMMMIMMMMMMMTMINIIRYDDERRVKVRTMIQDMMIITILKPKYSFGK